MRLESLHPGATVEQVQDTVGWEVVVSPSLAVTAAPTDRELRLIRVELDPGGVYTK
jgi:glutaconate CoA-transferase subunit B